MKKASIFFSAIFMAGSVIAQNTAVELKTSIDSVNYAYGVTIANQFKKMMDKDANVALFVAGFNAAVAGNQKISSEDANKRYNDYNTKVAQPRVTAKWKDDNTKFLEDNKKRKELLTTASGLQYEVLKKGEGTVSPKETDKVEVHYHGTLIDGQIFDSSVQRNKTATFGLNQVIRGWTEGLQYMKEGDKFRFYIPYNLAYGEQARGATIKGYSTLIFDVELFKVNP